MKSGSFNIAIAAAQVLAVAWGVLTVNAASAQDYPNRPIKIVVPYSAGGLTDLVARQMAKSLEPEFKQPFVIENKPGASGTLSAMAMIGAPPDGYQLAIIPSSVFRLPHLEKMALKPLEQLTYLGLMADYNFFLIVRNEAKWQNPRDFVTAMKASSSCAYGSPGVNSTPQFAMEEFMRMAGFSCTHIPYKGTNEAVYGLAANQVDIVFGAGGGPLEGLVATGKLKYLSTVGAKRFATHPALSTLIESGYPISAEAPFGLVGPAGMSKELVEKLSSAVRKAMTDKAMVELLTKNSSSVRYMGPQEFRAFAVESWESEKRRFAPAADKK